MSSPEPIEQCLDPNLASRPLPWVYWAAASIESVDPAEFDADPAVAERTLRSVAELFDLLAITVPFDPTVLAEALGCRIERTESIASVETGCVSSEDDAFDLPIAGVASRDRVPTSVEVVSRLAETVSGRSVLACVPGPTHLSSLLAEGDLSEPAETETLWSAGDAIVEVASEYLDADADALVLLEPTGLVDDRDVVDVVDPIVNRAGYYDRPVLLVTNRLIGETVDVAADIGFDAATGVPDETFEPNESIALGYGVPLDELADATTDELPAGYAFPTTEWEIPADTDIETITQFISA